MKPSITAHTPGPWKVVLKDTPYDHPIMDGQGNIIARVSSGYPESSADANLIAAAPELLAALEAVVASAGIRSVRVSGKAVCYGCDRWTITQESLDIARAAISQVKGI